VKIVLTGAKEAMATAKAQTTQTAQPKKPFYQVLYIQVLFGIVLGATIGWQFPDFATQDGVKALGEGFIKLIKMVIAPIIFCTVVSGISHIQDAKKVGRVGVKALVYFELVSTLALAIGLIIGNVLKPGEGFTGSADAAAVAKYTNPAAHQTTVEFLLNIIPDSIVGAFAKGEVLQVLLFAILFGFSLMALGRRGEVVRDFIDDAAHAIFRRDRHCHESGSDRRLRGDGLYDWEVWTVRTRQPGKPRRNLLPHGRALYYCGSRSHRADRRAEYL
jgi:aerobic C4-dicarboxylate transport protein